MRSLYLAVNLVLLVVENMVEKVLTTDISRCFFMFKLMLLVVG